MSMDLCLYATAAVFAEPSAKGTHVVVIDVLRASSTIVQAYESGVERIIPVAGVEEATRLLPTLDRENALLCGEQEGIKVDGFDLGNSPREYVGAAVKGKTLVLSTTNGTTAILKAGAADGIAIGCFLNLKAVVAHLVSSEAEHVSILCAGTNGLLALEDFVCGGLIINGLVEAYEGELGLNDAAVAARLLAASISDIAEVVRHSSHGQHLIGLGFEDDLEFCGRLDTSSSVPTVLDGRIQGREHSSHR
jgi:2-phosphosulfolactate phosphatase